MSCFPGLGPPSRVHIVTSVNDKSRDERWLEDMVTKEPMSPQGRRGSSEFGIEQGSRNKRLTEDQFLNPGAAPPFSKSCSTSMSPESSRCSSGSRSPSPTGNMRHATLCSAVRSGSTQAVSRLLFASRGNILDIINGEERMEGGEMCTPLSEAIRAQDHCTTRLLLDFHANPTLALSDSGKTPLSMAAVCADGDLISMLMQNQSAMQNKEAETWSAFRDTQHTRRPEPFG
eukprot:CAMPEP_0119059874 /NCGR_PEP_ID=MMETSP1178-20130426/3909_1 /TAXON_ID=33656 /ORGANISM="unid sp, Strain CCMP2000" /LENGTH=229 /DNA_ID=CAMNT_0007040935 /DNA_START=27 /DNA_END=716 /DNA_ORIENTATION=-